MIASEIRDNIKAIGTIPAGDADSDAAILAVINSSYHFLERIHPWSWLRRHATFQGKSGVMLYPLAGDGTYDVAPGSLYAVRDVDNQQPLESAEKTWIEISYPQMTETGRPFWYWMEGLDESHNFAPVYGFYPIFDGPTEMEYQYRKRLPNLIAADTPLLPEIYHSVLQDHACGVWLTRDQQAELAQLYQAQAAAGMARMIEDDSRSTRILVPGSRPVGRLRGVVGIPAGYGRVMPD